MTFYLDNVNFGTWRINSRLKLQNLPSWIRFQSLKSDFAAVASGFNRLQWKVNIVKL
jgi:hypothetical protein